MHLTKILTELAKAAKAAPGQWQTRTLGRGLRLLVRWNINVQKFAEWDSRFSRPIQVGQWDLAISRFNQDPSTQEWTTVCSAWPYPMDNGDPIPVSHNKTNYLRTTFMEN